MSSQFYIFSYIFLLAFFVACSCCGKQGRKSKTIKMLTNSVCSRWSPERGGRASCELLSVSSSFVAILLMKAQVTSFSCNGFIHPYRLKKTWCSFKKLIARFVASKKLIARLLHTRSCYASKSKLHDCCI
jgi:hypothetical protein